ncbi:carbohydrate kinase [Opitutaceae bacterium TAV5]|nr:carbohydrate kinase [Opitutaceae bacterium TAV5]
MIPSHPILSCQAAKAFEAAFFAGDEEREWSAMQRAGIAVAESARRDFAEAGPFPAAPRLLVLAGKGHNAGDALIAARHLLVTSPAGGSADVLFVFGERTLRPLAVRAWRELLLTNLTNPTAQAAPGRVRMIRAPDLPAGGDATAVSGTAYDLVLDGVFGFQFRPPLPAEAARVFAAVNALPVRLRVAVDLPSGLDASDAFRADFTYATGSVKTPLLPPGNANAGRVRYLDLGFFDRGTGFQPVPLFLPIGQEAHATATDDTRDRVLVPAVLDPLRRWRSPHSDKRSFGHVLLVGGSRAFPGAIFMAATAAVRSGAGLVTVLAPESLIPAFAAQLPEAMWVAWPETPDGGLALEGLHLIRERLTRTSSLVIGPGLGREPETLTLAAEIVKLATVPLVIDADALQPQIVSAGKAPRILTPHAGELPRIEKQIPAAHSILVRKGPVTVVETGGHRYHSLAGGPVLARGGSGDILAGLTGGLLAQTPDDPAGAACRGVAWHGAAADALARARGAVAVRTTELTEYLGPVLRETA